MFVRKIPFPSASIEFASASSVYRWHEFQDKYVNWVLFAKSCVEGAIHSSGYPGPCHPSESPSQGFPMGLGGVPVDEYQKA